MTGRTARSSSETRVIVLTSVLAVFLTNLDTGILNVSLPVIASSLDTTVSLATWTVLAYNLALTACVLLSGRVSRRFGFRKTYIWSLSIFTLTCLLCGFCSDIYSLSLFRLVQGASAGILYALGPLVIRSLFPAEEQGRWYGLIVAAPSAALLLGQPMGGCIAQYFPWNDLFFFQIPVCLAATGIALFFPRDNPARIIQRPFDTAGMILLFFSLTLLTVWMNQGEELGWVSGASILCLILSVTGFLLFHAYEKRQAAPLLEWRLFQADTYIRATRDISAYLFILSGFRFLLPFLLLWAFLLTPGVSGIILLIHPVLMILVSMYGGFFMRHLRPQQLITLGWGLLIGALVLYLASSGFRNIWVLGIAMVVSGISSGLLYPAAIKVVMDAAPHQYLEESSDLFSFSRTISQTLGVALFEMLWSEVDSGWLGPINLSWISGTSASDLAFLSFGFAILVAILMSVTSLLLRLRSGVHE